MFATRHGTLALLLAAFSCALLLPALASGVPSVSIKGNAPIARSLTALPMSFESNQGQTDAQVRFLSRGAGYSILFKDREAVLLLSKREPSYHLASRTGNREPQWPRSADSSTDILQMRMIGVGTTPVLAGEARLPGTANYFLGNDPAKWHARVATFERVRYSGVYPGVDLVYYGNGGRLEFDFELAAGTDPKAIQLCFDGAKRLKLDRDGNLVIVAGSSALNWACTPLPNQV